MIDYGIFQLATMPRTGSRWFMEAAKLCGFTPVGDNPFTPPPPDHNGLVVSLVRNPYTWVQSFHAAACADVFAERNNTIRAPGVAKDYVAMWAAIRLVRVEGQPPPPMALSRFGRSFGYGQNYLWNLHRQYQATCVLRLEDFPWCVIELLESVGGLDEQAASRIAAMPILNYLHREAVADPELRSILIAGEPEYCGRYNYW